MSAIEFVVRDSAGQIEHGNVAGDGAAASIIVSVDEDISLNLSRAQVQSYSRQGQALQVVLIDGRVIMIEGFFTPEGIPENDLYLSSGGVLAQVELAEVSDGFYYANYSEAEAFGKWSPDDDLYFLRGSEVQLAGYNEVYPVEDDQVGMLAAPLLAGIGGIGAGAGVGAAAIGGAAIVTGLTGGGSGGGSGVYVTAQTGAAAEDTVVNSNDYDNGIELGGTGTPGGEVTVTVGGATETTTVGDDGTWEVVFQPGDLPGGEYTETATVTITSGGETSTTTAEIVVDTVATVTLNEGANGGDLLINAQELAGGVTLSGTVETGSTVMVTVGGMAYEATVTGGSWSLTLPDGAVETGEYDLDVTVSVTDAYGNTSDISGSVAIDTETSVSMSTSLIGGDGTVNASEHAAGVSVTGMAQANASVAVTIGTVTHTVVAGEDGSWSATFSSTDLPEGTYDATVTAVATDLAGNTATTTGSFHVDTEMGLAINSGAVEGDGIVNGAEASDGITLTGTAEAGSSVAVTLNGFTRTVTAGNDGSWSASWIASELPTIETTLTVKAVATDGSGNVETTTGFVTFDPFVNTLTHTNGQVGGDGVVNLSEQGQAITASGMVEAGSTVSVSLGGVTLPATVAANGSWTVTYPAGTLAVGEYNTALVITATDAAGNTSQISESVRVDTVAGDLTLSSAQIEIDDVVNAVEVADGVVITGTATPGLPVTVTFGSATHTVVANSAGTWSSKFLASEIPTGTYDADITASITDAAGNSKTVSDSVHIDTQVVNHAFAAIQFEGDDMISGDEASDGFNVNGTVEPLSKVVVTFGSGSSAVTKTVYAGSDGQWNVEFTAGEIPSGEYTAPIVARATDPAGNVSTISDTVRVDTIVNTLTADATETDNVANAYELQDGITLTGTVEVGSTVLVTFDGMTRVATVGRDGSWEVTFDADEIRSGDYAADVTIKATDAVGNVRETTQVVEIDTIGPDAATVDHKIVSGQGIEAIIVSDDAANIELYDVTDGQHAAPLTFTPSQTMSGWLDFDTPIADETNLVVSATDDAGNETSTLVVLDEASSGVVDIANPLLDNFDFGAIDLSFAEDGDLTLTASDIEDLTKGSNELTIHGGSDDTVTINGAVAGGVETVDGTDFHVYTLGGNHTLYIEDGVNVII